MASLINIKRILAIPFLCYLSGAIAFGHHAPIVQWIEFQIPVLKMGVRIPLGARNDQYRSFCEMEQK